MTDRLMQVPRFLHGGDYSPEQWPREQWRTDIEKMKLAGANTLTLGIFAWAALEPEEGRYEMDWLGEALDLLKEHSCHAILSTPSAAQPAWLSKAYPEVLRSPAAGRRNRHGMRVNFCVSSPVYREKVRAINTELARRFGAHPALVAWHISNEFFEPCFCPVCEVAFREWLTRRYTSLDELNRRWNTAFWSHTYRSWEEIEAPALDGENSIEALWVNWKRFSSDQYASFIRDEVAPIREFSPGVPVTTNLMGTHEPLDYWRLAAELDFVSMDAYPMYDARPGMVDVAVEHSFVYDLMRSFKPGRPWLLMECTPSSANWMPVMKLKRPGIHMLTAMQAVAHGSDSVLYFQWRQGLGGREKFHGSVLDHTGSTETRVFREVAEVGERLENLKPVMHSTRRSEIALIYDWENRWAIHAACGPTRDQKDYLPTCLAHYRPLWQGGWPVDVIQSTCDFSSYRVLVAPMLAMLRPGVAERLEAFVEKGGTLIGTYWSGLVDEDDRLFDTPFPGPLARVFGIQNEETDILHPDEHVSVKSERGNSIGLEGEWEAKTFCALIEAQGAEVLARYAGDFYMGTPALTRHAFGRGTAYYLAFRGGEEFLSEFTGACLRQAGLPRPWILPPGVTVQFRDVGRESHAFFMNFTGLSHTISLDGRVARRMDYGEILQTVSLRPYGSEVLAISNDARIGE